MFNLILAIFLCVLIIFAAILAIISKKLSVSIIAAGLVSLLASIVYLQLAAPDVAMTEAAIGSGLSTIIFFYALNKVKRSNNG